MWNRSAIRLQNHVRHGSGTRQRACRIRHCQPDIHESIPVVRADRGGQLLDRNKSARVTCGEVERRGWLRVAGGVRINMRVGHSGALLRPCNGKNVGTGNRAAGGSHCDIHLERTARGHHTRWHLNRYLRGGWSAVYRGISQALLGDSVHEDNGYRREVKILTEECYQLVPHTFVGTEL